MSILIICSLFICSGWTAHVQFFFQDPYGNAETNKDFRMYPRMWGTNGSGKLLTRDWVFTKTDTNGSIIVSNVMAGTNWEYQSELSGKYSTTTNWYVFPVTNGLINAHDYAESTPRIVDSTAYSKTASDSRFIRGLTNDDGSITVGTKDANGVINLRSTGGGGGISASTATNIANYAVSTRLATTNANGSIDTNSFGKLTSYPSPSGSGRLPTLGVFTWYIGAQSAANSNECRKQMDMLATNGLRDIGWNVIEVDDGAWLAARDGNGKLQGDPTKFPNGDMAAFADYVHGRGFRLWHYMQWPGLPGGNPTNVIGFEDLDCYTIGNDFKADGLKYDNITSDTTQFEYIHNKMLAGIQRLGKPFVLKTSNGSFAQTHPWFGFFPKSLNVFCQGDVVSYATGNTNWSGYNISDQCWLATCTLMDYGYNSRAMIGPGHYLDLSFGLTWYASANYLHTDFGASCIFASCSFLSRAPASDIPLALAVFGNSEAVAINQDAAGIGPELVSTNGNVYVYVRPLGSATARDGWAVAIQNRDMTNAQNGSIWWTNLVTSGTTALTVRDIWNKTNYATGLTNGFTVSVPAKDLYLYKIYSPSTSGSSGTTLSNFTDSGTSGLITTALVQNDLWVTNKTRMLAFGGVGTGTGAGYPGGGVGFDISYGGNWGLILGAEQNKDTRGDGLDRYFWIGLDPKSNSWTPSALMKYYTSGNNDYVNLGGGSSIAPTIKQFSFYTSDVGAGTNGAGTEVLRLNATRVNLLTNATVTGNLDVQSGKYYGDSSALTNFPIYLSGTAVVATNTPGQSWTINSGGASSDYDVGATNIVVVSSGGTNFLSVAGALTNLSSVQVGNMTWSGYYFTNTDNGNTAQFSANTNGYFQIKAKNYSSGTNASADFIAEADAGTDSAYFIDMGINSSTFGTGLPPGSTNDGYVYVMGTNSANIGGNLYLGTGSTNTAIFFVVAGVTNVSGQITTNGYVGSGSGITNVSPGIATNSATDGYVLTATGNRTKWAPGSPYTINWTVPGGAAASTYYWPIGGYLGSATTTETQQKTYFPTKLQISGLVAHRAETSLLTGTNQVLTIRTNGVNTGITITLSGTTYLAQDLAHTCVVTTNDYVTLSDARNAAYAAQQMNISILATPIP